jgi:hypothetical protein
MARHDRFTILCTAALVVAPTIQGCAHRPVEASVRRNSAFLAPLTRDEIRRSPFENAYDAVRHLRPMFLASRGPTSILNAPQDDIVVIINDQVQGGVEDLRSVPAVGVVWVRRLSAAEVYGRLGRSAPSGGIELRVGSCSVCD